MTEFLALGALVLWPIIPLFWIPLHCAPEFFRKIGGLTYIVLVATWVPLAYLICSQRGLLLHYTIHLPHVVTVAGIALLSLGTSLHVWTGELLGFRRLVGIYEISPNSRGNLVTKGPFSVVRHPTYLAHSMMFSGVFLITGVVAVGILAVIDCLAVNIFIIPLEERELSERFREDFKEYKRRVPRFFPSVPRKRTS